MSIFGWLLGYVKLRMIVREFKKVPKNRIISKLIELTNKGKINWKVIEYDRVEGGNILKVRAFIGNSRTSLTFTFEFITNYIDIFRNDSGLEIFDYKLFISDIEEQAQLINAIENSLFKSNVPLTNELHQEQEDYKLLKRIFK